MQTMRTHPAGRRITAVILTVFLIAGGFCFNTDSTWAKGSLASGDTVKTVLVYTEDKNGDQVLMAQLPVSDMLTYLNSHLDTYGAVHNYSVLDSYVTPVHQEAQGFTVPELIEYAVANSTIEDVEDIGFSFSDSNDKIAFWEIDGKAFDAVDTYTYDSLYTVKRYNYKELYRYWNYSTKTIPDSDLVMIKNSAQAEEPLLSITAYSGRYMDTNAYKEGNYNVESYFDGSKLLDTARTMRLMLPMTEDDLTNRTPTASNSRYGLCYILLDMNSTPDFTSLGEVAEPSCSVIDGDESTADEYDAGYWYFTLSCSTDDATIYYNDNAKATYMPTERYTPGSEIKIAKNSSDPEREVTFYYRAVKDGYQDAGVQTASSSPDEPEDEDVDPNASVWNGTSVDTSWYNTTDSAFTISTAEQLVGLQHLVNNVDKTGAVDFAGKTVTLENNIHLNGYEWEPIGTHQGVPHARIPGAINNEFYYSFNGTFDGNGYRISGLNVNYGTECAYCGLFGKMEGAVIRNLTISGSVKSSASSAGLGGFAGYALDSTIENCTNSAKINVGGGIAGLAAGTTSVKNCENNGEIRGGAGIALHAGGSGVTISDCVNNSKISDATGSKQAGIAGDAYRLINCINYGDIKGNFNIGGIAGTVAIATGCENYGNISAGYEAGGIAGSLSGSASGCKNYGDITTIDGRAGGIAGKSQGSQIEGCLNAGTVTSVDATAYDYATGGIIGYGVSSVNDCANLGDISGYNYVGGLIGSYELGNMTAANVISNSYNAGSVTLTSTGAVSAAYCGGIAGYMPATSYTGTISNCYDTAGGAVLGNIDNGIVCNQVYYLTGGVEIGISPTTNRSGINSRTAAQMKEASFATALGRYNSSGNGTADGYYMYNAYGSPILYWQPAKVAFELTPSSGTVAVRNSGGTAIDADADGTYTLILGEVYGYTASADGYISKTGSFLLDGEKTLDIKLNVDRINTSGPNQVILSWSGDPATTQTVTWSDDESDTGCVQYVSAGSYQGESSFSAAAQVTAACSSVGYDDKAKQYWQATITGLSPDTTYYYRAGSSGSWSGISTFTTEKIGNRSFSFLYMGDIQYTDGNAASEYPEWGTMLESAYAANPDIAFGLLGGDMVNSGSDMSDWSYFLSYASNVFSKVPMMTTNGNHESNFTGGKPQFYTAIMGLPKNGPNGFSEEFYSFDYGTAHVTVLNSWVFSGEQENVSMGAINSWIEKDLEAASNAKFRIVMLHHPAYALEDDTVSDEVLTQWVPLLEAGKVDLVLCGHQHIYARSKPLANKTVSGSGITYVMGNSGQKFYSNGNETYQAKTIYNTSTYQILKVDGDALSLWTYDRNGSPLDSWSTTSKVASLTGDVDCDGDVDMDDVNVVFDAYIHCTDCDDSNSVMDVNNDNVIDIRDAHLILNIVRNAS